MMELAPAADVKELEVVSNRRELRRDLHLFANYFREREVKRAHRSNDLPKADTKRLARLMGDPETHDEVKSSGYSPWIDFIDDLALALGFVSYDTEGEYMGYSSTSPSYPYNYVKFQEESYERFLRAPLMEQEEALLNALVNEYDDSDNEFFTHTQPLSRLDTFSSFGCATGVVPTIEFDRVRRDLLDLLKECTSGVWYSTASFIQYLKKEHPFFLIPEKIVVKERWWKEGRYRNFQEGEDRWMRGEPIPDNAPDAFERVEGRYVERFLENIPLVMRYVDVAYERDYERKIYPSLNKLRAFRVNERFLRVMKRQIRTPKVTVLPTFEIHVDSDIYPVGVVTQLTRFADVITEDVAIVLKLKKEKVAAQLVEHEEINVIALLEELAGKKLPQNIEIDLTEWTAHAELFTLFDGFGLLECDKELKIPDGFTAENISPTMRIVRAPGKLYAQLEKSELVPLLIKHPDSSFRQPERGVKSVFRTTARDTKEKQKKSVNLKRDYFVTLYFPSKELLKIFSKELKKAKFPFGTNELTNAITFEESLQFQLDEIFEALEKDYSIKIEDVS
jgi:hypothetical protein